MLPFLEGRSDKNKPSFNFYLIQFVEKKFFFLKMHLFSVLNLKIGFFDIFHCIKEVKITGPQADLAFNMAPRVFDITQFAAGLNNFCFTFLLLRIASAEPLCNLLERCFLESDLEHQML